MRQLFSIIGHTIREEVRRKTFLILLLIPPVCIYTSTVFVRLTPGSEREFVVDIALSTISLFAMLLAALQTCDILIKEEQQGTIYFFSTNPVFLPSLIAGKLLGCFIFLVLGVFAIGAFTFCFISFRFNLLDYNFLKAIMLLPGQFLVLTAFGCLGATFLSKFTNLILIVIIYILGHLSVYLQYFQEHLGNVTSGFMYRFLFFIIPDLNRFEARNQAVLSINIEYGAIGKAYLYAVFYSGILYLISLLFFRAQSKR